MSQAADARSNRSDARDRPGAAAHHRQLSGISLKDYKDKGFEVLGFPANDFGAQGPGTHEEIEEFCKLN